MPHPTFEVFLLCDSNGDYAVGNSADAARERYEEDIGELVNCDGFRLVKMLVKVPLPEPVELSVEVGALDGVALCVA